MLITIATDCCRRCLRGYCTLDCTHVRADTKKQGNTKIHSTITQRAAMNRVVEVVSPLVSCVWLRHQLKHGLKNIRVVDASWHMGGGSNDARKDYEQRRINRSVFISIDELSDKTNSLPHMLPSAEQFSSHIGNLGISNDNHVVIYDNNVQYGMFSSARLWWMFRVFGHQHVSVLDGGFPRWKTDECPIAEEPPPNPAALSYTAKLREELVMSMNDVTDALQTGSVQVVDARSEGRFDGTAPEPRPSLPSGHMIGALNLPFYQLFNPQSKTLASKQVIEEEFKAAGVDLDKPILATCGSGVTACWIAFAASLLGKEVPVYDGSWTEYAEQGPPERLALGMKG